nr:sensor histidine kinase [Glycomyces sp. L485]
MLFPLISHLFWIGPLRATVPVVVALNFVPALEDAFDGASSTQVLWSLLVCSVTASASVAIGAFIYRIIDQSVERYLLIEELEASRAEVKRLSHEAGVAAERQRLGAELHDTVAQGLSSIVMLAQASRTATEKEQRDEQLRLIEQTSRANLAEARAMVEALSPGGGEAINVEDSLADLTEAAGAALVVDGETRRLPQATAVVLVRAVQEALRNVDKHTAGAAARVSVDFQDGAVAVSVTDDGPGFDPKAPSAGFGLRGVRNRVIGLGGTFEVDSAPGRGVAVRLEVPA